MSNERRPATQQPEPEPPPPPPIFRTLPAATVPAPVVVTPPPLVTAEAAGDLQRDVGPTVAVAPVRVSAPAVAAPPRTVRPRWAQRPSARDMQNAYPAAAQRRGAEGRVVLDCLIGADLAIRCRAVTETPAGFGFATAALRVAQQFRAAPTLEDGRPAAGERAQVVLLFKPE